MPLQAVLVFAHCAVSTDHSTGCFMLLCDSLAIFIAAGCPSGYLPYWYGRLFALQTCLETLAAQAAVNTAVKTPDPVRPAIFGHFC